MEGNFLINFSEKFDRMKDYPERETIRELTEIAKDHIMSSQDVATFIVTRIIDPRTNSSFKLPMFYLIDSIMKHVGGPYASLFSKLLSEIYPVAFSNLHKKDCERVIFLLSTWEERKLLPNELILSMKENLGKTESVSFYFTIKVLKNTYYYI
jgi:hypothetical protein